MIAAQGTAKALRSMTALRRRILSSSSSSLSSSQQLPKTLSTRSSYYYSSNPSRSFSSSSSTTTTTADDDAVLTEQEKVFYKQGILDERGLTVFDTLHEMQVRSCQVYASHPLFGTYSNETQQFEWTTFAFFENKVDTCRALLKDLGVAPYDKIGIISNNRWEWACIAAAAYSLNANLVPMYEAQLPDDWTYILNDSGAKTLFCANADIFQRVKDKVLPNAPLVSNMFVLDSPADTDAAAAEYSFAHAMSKFQPDAEHKLIVPPTPDDLANLIYTSGTTGKPKGVELTHLNFTSNVKAAARTMVQDPREFVRHSQVSLAFLPWAHSYGQTCELWMSISHGASMGICRGVPQILDDLQLVQPTVLFAVPTLYKKVYDGVHNLIEAASPLRKKLMKSALRLGHAQTEASMGRRGPLGMLERMQYNVLNKIVLSKIRARFGGKLEHGFVAGAACPSEVLAFMDNVGIPICEGYGLTETSPIICINTPEQRQVGSVGRAIGGVDVYIIDESGKLVPDGQEGEICCVGPNVMHGYYKNPAATAEVISIAPDGKSRMFHTGDLGRKGEDGFVKVTGRLKEQYKLENGKYVCPTPIEEAIGMSRFIAQVVLCGANRPYNVALIVPEWATIRSELKIDAAAASSVVSEEELANDARVKELIDNQVALMTKEKVKKFEVPQAWAFVAPFTAANNMLTPKMSIRRHKVIQTYGDVISRMYGDDPIVAEAADSKGAKEHAA